MRGKPPVRYGAENNRYNGGLCVRSDGRCVIVCRDGTLMMFYRGVMAAHIGRLLDPAEIVHHVNHDPSDDRIENLEITTRSEHVRHHRPATTRPLITHCKRGHEYTSENTYEWRGSRQCRACNALRARGYAKAARS